MAEIEHLSFSRLKAYACPYRFQKLYLEGVAEPVGDLAHIGGDVHRLIRDSLVADYPMAEVGEARPGDDLPPSPAVMDEAENLFAVWVEKFDMAGMDPIGVEVRAEALLDDMTPFRGYLDLACEWQGTLVIYDWKTSWHMPSSLGDDPQLATYAWLGIEKWPEYAGTDVLLRQYYARFGRYVEAQISPAGVSNVAFTLSRFAERLKAADASVAWPANPCEQCGFCRLTCPLVREIVRPPQDAQGAENLAGLASALSDQYDAARDALKVWCDEHGAVSAAGHTWSFVQNEQRYCPLTARQLYERFGDEAWALLEVGSVAVKHPPEGLELATRLGRATFTSHKER